MQRRHLSDNYNFADVMAMVAWLKRTEHTHTHTHIEVNRSIWVSEYPIVFTCCILVCKYRGFYIFSGGGARWRGAHHTSSSGESLLSSFSAHIHVQPEIRSEWSCKNINFTLVMSFPASNTNLYSLYSSDTRLWTKIGRIAKKQIMVTGFLKKAWLRKWNFMWRQIYQ